MDNFPGPVWGLWTFKHKVKTAFTYNIQSVIHCRKFSMKQNVGISYLSKQQSTQTGCCTIAARFPFERLEKCMTFKKKNPGLSRRRGNPVEWFYAVTGVLTNNLQLWKVNSGIRHRFYDGGLDIFAKFHHNRTCIFQEVTTRQLTKQPRAKFSRWQGLLSSQS